MSNKIQGFLKNDFLKVFKLDGKLYFQAVKQQKQMHQVSNIEIWNSLGFGCYAFLNCLCGAAALSITVPEEHRHQRAPPLYKFFDKVGWMESTMIRT